MATFTDVHDSHDHTGIPGVGGGGGGAFVGCSASNSANQSLANNTATLLTWNAEHFDTDAIHDTSTNPGRFTVPAGMGGKWQMVAHLTFASHATGQRTVELRVNGGTDPVVRDRRGAFTGDCYVSFAAPVLNLAAGDYVELYGLQNSGGALNVYGTVTAGNEPRITFTKVG
jgi:hypothetical protein